MTASVTRWYIYALVDPRDDAVRYVGKSINVRYRVSAHLRDRSSTRKARWIRSLIREGLEPTIRILEEGIGCWEYAEIHWIAHFLATGSDLTNASSGGEGLHEPGDETKRRISAAQRALHADPLWRAAALARYRDPDRSAAISAALKGRPKTPDHLAKLPQNSRGYKVSPERREKLAVLLREVAGPARSYGPLTAEHKAKISTSLTGRPGWAKGRVLSPAERAVRSASLAGRPKSPEHKEKLRQAALRRWASERGEMQ